MSKTVEVRSNIAGKLNKIRAGVVYQNVTSVLGELGQNAQRGINEAVKKGLLDHVTDGELHIEVDASSFTFTDNGIGCDDPQLVFEFDKSGFGYGFGEGFSSVFTIADELIVHSGEWRVWVDIKSMLANEEFHLPVEQAAKTQGFRVYMSGEKICEHKDELLLFAHEMAELLPMKVYINGELIKKRDLMTDVKDYPPTDFLYPVENDLYSGVMTPANYQYLKLYFESRYVCDQWMWGSMGNIMLNPDAVTLKAPDRRSVIDDNKYYDFKEQLRQDTVDMYKAFIKTASDEDLNRFDEKIVDYVEAQDLLDVLKIDDSMLYEEVLRKQQEVREEEDGEYTEEAVLEFKEAEPSHEDVHSTQGITDNVSVEKTQPTRSIKELEGKKKTAWLRARDLESYGNEIKELEYFGYKIIVAKNRLYEKAFSALGLKEIDNLTKDTQEQTSIENVELKTQKEKRFLALLRKVEKKFGISDVFHIADIKMKVETYLDGKKVETEEKRVLGLAQGSSKIYLDRKSMEFPKYRMPKQWDDPTIRPTDIVFLMRNMDTVAHELAHLLYGTNDLTPEHITAQGKIAREIADLF